MNSAIPISPAMQDYLEVILNLSENTNVVRVTDIAARLNIAKASVTQTVNKLKDLGLVIQDKYGPVGLSHAGRELAVKVQHRHRTLQTFLIEVLGVEPRTAEKDACLMEHVVSPQTMERLVEFLANQAGTRDDRGISSKGRERLASGQGVNGGEAMRSVNTKRLSELKPGERGRVIRITNAGHVRHRVLEMGVTPGTEVHVRGVAPLGDPMEIGVKGYRLSLRREEAHGVFVEVL